MVWSLRSKNPSLKFVDRLGLPYTTPKGEPSNLKPSNTDDTMEHELIFQSPLSRTQPRPMAPRPSLVRLASSALLAPRDWSIRQETERLLSRNGDDLNALAKMLGR